MSSPRDIKALATDAFGFGFLMAAFFGWYVVLCPPGGAASPRAAHDQVAVQLAAGR